MGTGLLPFAGASPVAGSASFPGPCPHHPEAHQGLPPFLGRAADLQLPGKHKWAEYPVLLQGDPLFLGYGAGRGLQVELHWCLILIQSSEESVPFWVSSIISTMHLDYINSFQQEKTGCWLLLQLQTSDSAAHGSQT